MNAVERGQALQALRKTAGLTQAAVGGEFGISKQAVAEWESGKSRPDVHRLRKLDELYAAGGRVLEVFDLQGDELSRLRASLDETRAAVALLARVVREELQLERDELRDAESLTATPDGPEDPEARPSTS